MESSAHKSICLWVTRTPDSLRKSLWALNTAGSFFLLFLFDSCQIFVSSQWIIKLVSLFVECTQTSFTLPEIICNTLGCYCVSGRTLLVKLGSCSCGFSERDWSSSSNFITDTKCRGMTDPVRLVWRCFWNIAYDWGNSEWIMVCH